MEDETNRFDFCLVGRFLTEKNINGRIMKTKMADIWRPAMGITIKDIKSGLFLFQFYQKMICSGSKMEVPGHLIMHCLC